MPPDKSNIVALIDWNHLIEDFLDKVGLSIQGFCDKMNSGWMFGYIEALKQNNVSTILFCFSDRVKKTERFIHKQTGAVIYVLPTTRAYKYIRKRILNPYATTVEESAGNISGFKRIYYSFLLKTAAYASTPLFLLYSEIKKNNCSVILCQDYEHARFDMCVLLGKFMRIPVFATFQGGNFQISKFEKPIRPFTLKKCTGIIVASGIEIKRLTDKYQLSIDKIKKIFNPVDLSVWIGNERESVRTELKLNINSRIVIWHGRVDYYRKGLDILLDAWKQISLEQPDHQFELLLIGTGNNADILKQRLEQDKLKGVHWINQFINDRKLVYNYLKSANIYVFPSRNEGFAVAPLEAMACGLPLISFNAPGISDVLKDGEKSGGVLLPEYSSKALATAIKKLLENNKLCEELGHLAKLNIEENFSLPTIGNQLKNFLYK